MANEGSPRKRTFCWDSLIRAALGLDIRFCLFAIVLSGLVLFVVLGIFMTAADHRGLENDLEALHVNGNVMFNDSVYEKIQPTEPPMLLLILVHASGSAEGRKKRDAIRNTWLSEVDQLSQTIGQSVKYRFVLGGKNLSSETESNLTREAEVYRDLIVLDNVTDSHDTLTQRTLLSFEYIIKHNYNFQYIFKCDDDTYVNLKVIVEELRDRQRHERFYWGEFQGATGILREGPYAEQKWSTCETYVPYAYGGGYLLSRDLVELVTSNAPHLMIYKNEDVSVGAWLAPYNIEFQFDARFNTGGVSRGCKKQFIIMHKILAEQMYDYHNAFKKDGYICNRKNRWFGWHGHIYNWKTLPSKCCRRRRRIP